MSGPGSQGKGLVPRYSVISVAVSCAGKSLPAKSIGNTGRDAEARLAVVSLNSDDAGPLLDGSLSGVGENGGGRFTRGWSFQRASSPGRRFLTPLLAEPLLRTCGNSQFDPVVRRVNQILLGAQVFFSGLDRRVAQQRNWICSSTPPDARHILAKLRRKS